MRLAIVVGSVTLSLTLTAPRLTVERGGERIPPVSRTAPRSRGGLVKAVAETRAAKPAWRAEAKREAEAARALDLYATKVLEETPEPANFCAPVTMATIPIEV